MKTFERYAYRTAWLGEDSEYVGLCAEMPSLSWLAPSLDEALRGIRKLVRGVVKDMTASGEKTPEPLFTRHG